MADFEDVFEIKTLSDSVFTANTSSIRTVTRGPVERGHASEATCSVPFTTADGRDLIAIGCAEGVWVGERYNPSSFIRVLNLPKVTQCATLSKFEILLVLADKSLIAFRIEDILSSFTRQDHNHGVYHSQTISKEKNVEFFSVGKLGDRNFIIYMRKKGLDSIFRVLEPNVDAISDKSKMRRFLVSLNAGGRSQLGWFRVFKDFFLPVPAFDIVFLRTKIVVLTSKFFEIMEMTGKFQSITLPTKDGPGAGNLSKRTKSARPVAIFRAQTNEFLLCFNTFGLYVDQHGDPSRPREPVVEWEGKSAHRAAVQEPYLLLFHDRCIEIRHLETGYLVQIIPGTDIKCLYDAHGDTHTIHAVMTILGPVEDGGLRQHVVELEPIFSP